MSPKSPSRRGRLLAAGAVALLILGVLVWLVLLRSARPFRGDTGDASVLLITVDTLRADHLGAYGHREARTPVIDSLADEGVLFERVMTSAVMTLPSHATILTGTWPPAHGLRNNGDHRLAAGALTLAEVLRARGFRTGAVIGSFVLDSMFGLDQGFETYDDALPARAPHQITFAERPAAAVTDAAVRFLRGGGKGRFFLWAHYFDPHLPYLAPPAFARQHPRRPYDAEIAYVDAEIGRLLAALREAGLRDRTLVVLAGDHGEGLGDHGESSHGVFVYEEASRVPLIVSLPPHLPSGRRVRAVGRTVDIMPTILELIRIDPHQAAASLQGSSLWPLMATEEAAAGPGRPAYTEAMAPLLMYGWSPLISIRDERHRYIDAPIPELYDLQVDPGERSNLAASRPEAVAGLRARLETMRQELAAAAPPAEPLAPDPVAAAKLRSLGYAAAPAAPATPGLPDPKTMLAELARIDRVYAAFGAGQHEAAASEAREILAQRPDNANVRFYLGAALAGLGRFPEAITEFNKLLDRDPRDTEAMSNIGWCLLGMQRYDDATKVFNKVLEIYPGHVHAMSSLANVAFVKGDFREAMRLYKQTLVQEPNHLLSIKALGQIYEGLGKLDEAAVIYAHGLEVDPRDLDLLMNLAWVRFQQGKHQESLDILGRARAVSPETPELEVAAGDVLFAMQRLDEARAAYARAAQLAPDLAGAAYGLGLVELQKGEPARAVDLLSRAVALNPARATWREDLARALAGAGRYEAAARELRRYLDSGQAPADRRESLLRDLKQYLARR